MADLIRRGETLEHLDPGPRRLAMEQPRRLEVHDDPFVPAPKPGPDETPWRSRFYVNARNSADGNGYRRGEPIPEAEAERQRIPGAGRNPRVRIPQATCPRCRGSRILTNPRPPGHAAGCGCHFCGPCPRCEGSGYVVIRSGAS